MSAIPSNLSLDEEILMIIDNRIPYLTREEVEVVDDLLFLESLYLRIKNVEILILKHTLYFGEGTDIHDPTLKQATSFLNAFNDKR